jgi:hypothetical protein
MADRFATRRAGQYRHRAAEIEQRQLPRVRDEADRRHLLELAATYRRAADQMVPPPQSQILHCGK